MFGSKFLKLFPPPKFLTMPYAGLDISDNAVYFLKYGDLLGRRTIASFGTTPLPPGLFDEGHAQDEQQLVNILKVLAKKSHLRYVKVSVPEEKAYLFQTEVPSTDTKSIRQNIESKLEENVPLSAKDALFYFDVLPVMPGDQTLRATVSVVPRTYIDHMSNILHQAGLVPVAFEIVPKALARVIVPAHSSETLMVIHGMQNKVGIYIVSAGVVCFSTTTTNSSPTPDSPAPTLSESVAREVLRIFEYWTTLDNMPKITGMALVGNDVPENESALREALKSIAMPIQVPNIWEHITRSTMVVPDINKADSLKYAVAAGLGLPI